MIEVTENDKAAAKQHQHRFLTEGRSETELLWEAFATHRIEAAKAERDRLDNIPTNWELTWGPVDDDDGSPCAWLVFSRSGGRSDKEWTLLATGETPTRAITAALDSQP